MEIITQTLFSLTIQEVAKTIGVNMLLIILLVIVLFFYNKKKHKFSKLEISLMILTCVFYFFNSLLMASIEELKELNNLQKQVIEKQEKTITDYKKSTQNFLQNLENLDNKIQMKLEIQEFIKNFSEGHQK